MINPVTDAAKIIRESMIAHVAERLSGRNRPATVLLSSGAESGMSLAACRAAGISRLSAATAYLMTPTEDSRGAAARAASMGIPWIGFRLDPKIHLSVAAARRAVRMLGGNVSCPQVETVMTLLPLVEKLLADGHDIVCPMRGSAPAFSDGREDGHMWTRDPVAWQRGRIKSLLDVMDAEFMADSLLAWMTETAGAEWVDPFFARDALLKFLYLDWNAIHGGGMKRLGLLAFPEVRATRIKKSPAQIGSGVKGWMEIYCAEAGTNRMAFYKSLAGPKTEKSVFEEWWKTSRHLADAKAVLDEIITGD